MSANGNWTMTVQSPMGAQQGTLAITVEGATFKGTQTSASSARPTSRAPSKATP